MPAVVEDIDLNAELRHRADSHVDVPRALNRRGEDNVAVAFEQRKREQQTGDKLRADAARYAVNAAL